MTLGKTVSPLGSLSSFRTEKCTGFLVEGENQEDADEIIDEDEEAVSRSSERRLSSISDEERSKISEAVSAQAKAIQELMNSNKFASISRSNSTVSYPFTFLV